MTSCYDVVYTWVNDRDLAWRKLYQQATRDRSPPGGEHASANDPARFHSRDELYYSIRSVRKYAPWVRNIYIVTNCALPEWACKESQLFHVPHESLFSRPKDLPTFNAFAIETVLHLIKGLSENFLYFNDDFFLCRDVRPEDFFSATGVYYFPSSHDIPYGQTSELLRPVDTGAINAAHLLYPEFRLQPGKKLHHSPYPLSKTILQEIEAKHQQEVQVTRSHAFRHPDDVAVATTLHAYYADYTGRAEPRTIAARYVDIGDWRFLGLVHPWSPLMRGKYATLCLNEVTDIGHFRVLRDRIVIRVMKRLYD